MRKLALGVAVAVVIAAAIALWWFWWVPKDRPSLRDDERIGIDISAHQGKIEWTQVADDDIEFAYIKATEGGNFVDNSFKRNWERANSAGIETGVYHFFTLCTPGTLQAANFLIAAPPAPEALPPAVDLELAGNCRQRPATADVMASLREFLVVIERAWRKEAVLYVGADWEERYPVMDELERPLWLRRFLIRPGRDWFVWQLHGRARVDGIKGEVDLDVMRRRTRAR